MQEDEETGVAESWQEIIFRVHQPPPAQSAEKKLSSRLSTEDGGERALLRAGVRVGESTGESSHVYVLETGPGPGIVSDVLDSRWDNMYRGTFVHVFPKKSSKLSSRCPVYM